MLATLLPFGPLRSSQTFRQVHQVSVDRVDAPHVAATDELAAMQDVLATDHCAIDEWELERAAIERPLREVATTLESGTTATA